MKEESDNLNAGQLVLMNLSTLTDRPDVVESIAARPVDTSPAPTYRHTGARFFQKLREDADLAEQVWTGLRLGISRRLLARRLGVSPNTLAAAAALMTERGELDPVRVRVDRLLDAVGEEGLEYWLDGMRSGVIHPGQLPIPVLAALTNKAQREVGVVPGTGRTGAELTRDSVLAALQLAGLSDTASEESHSKASAIIDISAAGAGAGAGGPVVQVPPAGAGRLLAAGGAEAGGGVSVGGGGSGHDGSQGRKSEPKDAT